VKALPAVAALALIGSLLFPSAANAAAEDESCIDPAAYKSETMNAVLDVVEAPASLPTLFSGMCSNHGYPVDMTYRFDYDADGVWDEENDTGIGEHRFEEAGTYPVRLQVEDGFGRIAETTAETVIPGVEVLGPPSSPEDGARIAEGYSLAPESASPGEEVTVSGPLAVDASLLVMIVPASADPWSSAESMGEFGPFTGDGTWSLSLPADIESGDYAVLLVATDGSATELPLTVTAPPDGLVIIFAAVGSLLVVGGIITAAVLIRRKRDKK
jgi:hypothetical protein